MSAQERVKCLQLTSCVDPSVMNIYSGIVVFRSNSVCSLMAALVDRNVAHQMTSRQRSITVASRAYILPFNLTSSWLSSAYNSLACSISFSAKSRNIR